MFYTLEESSKGSRKCEETSNMKEVIDVLSDTSLLSYSSMRELSSNKNVCSRIFYSIFWWCLKHVGSENVFSSTVMVGKVK